MTVYLYDCLQAKGNQTPFGSLTLDHLPIIGDTFLYGRKLYFVRDRIWDIDGNCVQLFLAPRS